MWWMLVGVNYILALFGAYIGEMQLCITGGLTALACCLSGYCSKKAREEDKE